MKRSPNDNYGFIPLEDFRKDPEKYPITTKSGKLEIHCQDLAEFVNGCGWSEIKPTAEYIRPIEGYEASFSDWETRTKGEFPLKFYSIHYLRRAGATYHNVEWLREAWPQDFFMNTLDANERGIKHGDTIKAFSRHGAVIRRAHVTNRIRPGVCCMGGGAWPEWDEKHVQHVCRFTRDRSKPGLCRCMSAPCFGLSRRTVKRTNRAILQNFRRAIRKVGMALAQTSSTIKNNTYEKIASFLVLHLFCVHVGKPTSVCNPCNIFAARIYRNQPEPGSRSFEKVITS